MARGRGRGRGRSRKIPLAAIENLITTIKLPVMEKLVTTPPTKIQSSNSSIAGDIGSIGSTLHQYTVPKKLDSSFPSSDWNKTRSDEGSYQ